MALATGTLIGLTRAIKNAVGEAIEFEREMVKISQATGKTMSDLKSLSSEIGNVASNFGVSSKELVLAARELTQAGFAADKVRGTLKLLAQTELAATFDSIQDTTEGVIAVLNQFGKTAQRAGTEIDFLEKSLSAINQVSKDFAVESADLITAIRTTGSAFESAGGSLDELIALFTSVRSTTRESAESIATGFRTIFTRVQRVDTINALRNLGIELQDAEGKFVGPMEAAKRLAIALQTIDPRDFRFNLVVEELGGFRQVSKVIPLIQQFTVAQKALSSAQGASGSLAKDAATAQQSLSVQIDKTREEFKRFIRELTDSKSFQDTARFLLSLANAFIKVADTIKPLIPLIATFATFKLGQAFIPAIKGLGSIGKKSLGGPIGFASGGMVPGQGNGDTVPAMLTPGEFVIRKSSVEKLGAENLARMNKYAAGGRVTIFPKSNKYGVFALQPLGAKDDILRGKAKVKNKSVEAQLAAMAKNPDASVEIAADDTYQVPAFYIGGNDAEKSQAMKKRIEKVTKAGFKKIISTIIETPDFSLGSPPLKTDQSYFNSAIKSLFEKDNSAKATIEGYVLEAVTASLGQVKLGGGTSNWDFPSLGGKGEKLSQLFGLDKAGLISSLISGDAKRSISDKAIRSVLGTKIANSLLQDRSQIGLTKYDQTGAGVKIESSKAVAKKQQAQVKQSSLKGMQAQSEEFRKKIVEIAGEYFNFAKDPNTGLQASRLNLQNFGAGATDLVKGILGPDMKGKFGKNDFSLSEAEQKKVLDQLKKWREGSPPVSLLKSALGGIVSRFAEGGGVKNAPLVDDILQATGAILPHPVKAIQAIIDAGGGAVDMDRTLKRTIGDQAYAKAPTKKAQAEVLKRYFRDDAARLADVKSAPLTQFGKALKDAVESGQINPRKMQIISKSGRTPGLAEYLSSVFGIPVSNMVFTEGKTKQPALDALRQKGPRADRVSRFASGGFASGTDTVPAMLTPGEFVINKQSAQKIGYSNLHRMNKVAKFANGGAVGVQHLAIGGEVDQQSHYKPNNKESLDSVLSKHRDDELQSNFIKTANLSPNFAESLSKYRELGLIQKSNSKDRNSSTKSFIAAYGLSKLKDEDLKNKFKDKFEINDEIKNIFKYYDSGISDLVSYLGKQDKIKLSQITGHDFSKNKNYGNIEIFSGKNDILARYVDGENDRTGFVEAKKNKDNFYRVKFSYATSGYGPKLYDALLEEAAKIGSWVAPDTNISKNAAGVWKNYYLNRQDVNKKLMDYNNWNNASGKFQTKPEKDIEKLKLTWPKKEDPDWALQYAYQKPSSDNKNIIRAKKKFGPSYEGREAVLASIKNFATGGKTSGTDTVPAMLTPGEFVINKQSAQAIGYSSLNRMNKVGKFANGGPVGVQYFATGGTVDPATLKMLVEIRKMSRQALTQGPTASGAALGSGNKQIQTFIKMVEALNKAGLDSSKLIKEGFAEIKKDAANFKISKELKATYKEAASNTSNNQEQQLQKASQTNIQNLLLLGSAIGSVVTQFTTLSDEQKAYYGALTATFTVYQGIGQNLKNFGLGIIETMQQRKQEKLALAQSAAAMKNHANAANQAATQIKSGSVGSKAGSTAGGSGIGGTISKLDKGMVIFDGIITGFSAVMAIAAANAAYYAEVSEKSAKKMNETIDALFKDASKVSTGKLTSDISQASSDKAKASLMGKIGSDSKSIMKILGAAIGGGIIGGKVGGVAGTATGVPGGTLVGAGIGATAGAFGGAYLQYQDQVARAEAKQKQMLDDLNAASASLAVSFKTSAEETQKLQKFMGSIDKKTDKQVSDQAAASTTKFVQSLDAATNAELKYMNAAGSLVEAQKLFGDQIKQAKEKADEFGKALDQIIGAEYARQITQLGNKIGTKGVDVGGEISKIVESQKENISKRTTAETKSQYGAKIEDLLRGAGKAGTPKGDFAQFMGKQIQSLTFGKGGLNEKRAEKGELELEKSATEAAIQIIKQKQALAEEEAIRKKLIGTLADQLALSIGLENFEYSIKKANDSIVNAGAMFGDSLSAFSSSVPNADVLSLSAPNAANSPDFKKAMDTISSVGPIGKELADKFNQLNGVMPKLKVGLEKNTLRVGASSKEIDSFIQSIGIDGGTDVGKAIRESIEKETKSSEITPREGVSSGAEIAKRIQDNIENYAKILQEGGGRILKAMQDHEASITKAYDEIAQSRKRQLDIELEGADSFQELVKNVANAQGKILTLTEKNALRTNRQNMLAGKYAGNPEAIGKRLRDIRTSLAKETDIGKKAGLLEESTKLKQSLKELSNQSSRTADTLFELEKLKAQRETARDATKSYLFGTREEKDKQEDIMVALRDAMQSGDIESIPDELKSGVSGLLDQFKDVKAFGGMTGKEVQNQLMANKMMQMGNVEGAMAIANDTSGPEQQMIQELGNIYAQEEKARRAMLLEEMLHQDMLNQSIQMNTQSLNNLVKETQEKAAELRPAGGPQNLETPEALQAQKKAAEARLTKIDSDIATIDQSIEKFLQRIDNMFQQVKDKFDGTEKKSTGGLIYRAGGGFTPRGTDTVPAMLTPGEFVVNKRAVDKFGAGNLQKINAGYYANGGNIDQLGLPSRRSGNIRSRLDEVRKQIEQGVYKNKEGKNINDIMDMREYRKAKEQAIKEAKAEDQKQADEIAKRGRDPKIAYMQKAEEWLKQRSINTRKMEGFLNPKKVQSSGSSKVSGPIVQQKTMISQSMAQQQRQSMATTPAQQANAAVNPGAAGAGAMPPDMTGFAQSVESLNSIAATFSSFTETLANLANQFAGITVQHTMTVDGSIAVTGVNGPEIAKQLSDAIIGQIRTEVLNQIQLNNRQEKR
jgi:hypothetical protein